MTDDGLAEGMNIIQYLGRQGPAHYGELVDMASEMDVKTSELTEMVSSLVRFNIIQRTGDGVALTNFGKSLYDQLTG